MGWARHSTGLIEYEGELDSFVVIRRHKQWLLGVAGSRWETLAARLQLLGFLKVTTGLLPNYV